MAVAHGKDNTRINCICPSTVQTEVWEPMIERNPNILDEITPWYPLGRIGKPADIANTSLFLASDETSFSTGAVFVIDGWVDRWQLLVPDLMIRFLKNDTVLFLNQTSVYPLPSEVLH